MSDSNKYADLEIRILEKGDLGYPVEITFNGNQEFPRGFLDPTTQPSLDRARPQESGERLFRWLFASAELQSAWAQARGGQSLRRVRLRIDEDAASLHALPWEILRDPGFSSAPQDLASMEATPFSRYFAGPWVPGSPILKRPIRILVAIANPEDLEERGLTRINANEEWDLVSNATAGTPGVELVRLPEPCTLAAIEAALRTGFHILHFVGHGHYSQGLADMYLADEHNRTKRVEDSAVAGMLSRQLMDTGTASDDKLRLVFLSCCQSAVRSPADAFRGLAPKLVRSGVPAVIAMQDMVPVKTAHAFTSTFYQELLQHGEVDRASNAARSSLLTEQIRGAAIPVLFMRLRSGQLLGTPGKILGPLRDSAWNTLLDNIRRKNCTPILGPGVTVGLLPQPEEVARELASKSVFPFPDSADFLRVSQVIGTIDDTSLREQVLAALVAGFRRRSGLAAKGGDINLSESIAKADWNNLSSRLFETEIHRQLSALHLPLYLTTNFDNFMALALQGDGSKAARRETVSWKTPPGQRYDFDRPAKADDPVVLHLFGTDQEIQSMVLTEDDHLDYLANISHDHDNFLPFSVNERLASTTLLFIGYRLEDLSLKVILRGLVKNLDLGKWNRLQLAVQLESSRPDEAAEKEVVDYLQRTIQQCFPTKAPVRIYWGSAQQFMQDLWSRWERYEK